MTMMPDNEKLKKLRQIILDSKNLAVAFSGGVDSTFLLLFAKKTIDAHNSAALPSDKVNLIAVTAQGPNFAPDEISYAVKLCKEISVKHLLVPLGSEFLKDITEAGKERCYLCKTFIFSKLKEKTGNDFILADGTNADDSKDFRPGRKALKELKIKSPLEECGLTKKEIRQALKDMNADIWDKPAFACLASRIPYDDEITEQKLQSIYSAELVLKNLGFKQVRVRCHGDAARIEVLPEDRSRFFDTDFISQLNDVLKSCGFKYVSLDLGGYIMGNLNR